MGRLANITLVTRGQLLAGKARTLPPLDICKTVCRRVWRHPIRRPLHPAAMNQGMNPYEAPADESGPVLAERPAPPDWLVRGFASAGTISGVLFLLPLFIFPWFFLFYAPWPFWVAIAFGKTQLATCRFWLISFLTSSIVAAQVSCLIHYEPHFTWGDPSLLFFWAQPVTLAVGSCCLWRSTRG